jgi:hypothetical protein
VPAVDEAEVGGGLVEAEEFLEALRELADLLVAGAESVCLAGAQPGLDVVDDDPEPRAAGDVGAGAAVQAAGEQQADPAGISAGTVSAAAGLPVGRRWLPGTMRVAPLSARAGPRAARRRRRPARGDRKNGSLESTAILNSGIVSRPGQAL